MRTRFLLPIAVLITLVGCETEQPGDQGSAMPSSGKAPAQASFKIPKGTPVFIVLDTTDVLYPGSVLGEGGLEGLSRRVRKYLVNYLDEHGVKTAEADTGAEPKLIVKLDTVETKTRSDIGLFSPVVKQDIRMKFNVTMNSGDGARLFKFDGDESDESIDTLARKVGEKVGGRVPRYFK